MHFGWSRARVPLGAFCPVIKMITNYAFAETVEGKEELPAATASRAENNRARARNGASG